MQGLVSHQPTGDGAAGRSVSGLQLHHQERGVSFNNVAYDCNSYYYGKGHQL